MRRPRFIDTPEKAGGGPALALPVIVEDSSCGEEGGETSGGTAEGEGEKRHSIPNSPARAKSLRHLMTHLPKNSHCDTCMRANMVKCHARRRHTPAGPNAPREFGDAITAEHLFSANERGEGADGERYAS